MQVTIVVERAAEQECAAIAAWFERWSAALRACSDDLGCGCCVHIWEVDAPEAAVAELPPQVQSARPPSGHH